MQKQHLNDSTSTFRWEDFKYSLLDERALALTRDIKAHTFP